MELPGEIVGLEFKRAKLPKSSIYILYLRTALNFAKGCSHCKGSLQSGSQRVGNQSNQVMSEKGGPTQRIFADGQRDFLVMCF